MIKRDPVDLLEDILELVVRIEQLAVVGGTVCHVNTSAVVSGIRVIPANNAIDCGILSL